MKDVPGYKNPPVHSRFKPGQSGNPKGRPGKPQLPIGSYVAELLSQKTYINENGKIRRITYEEKLLRGIIKRLAEGDDTAIDDLMLFMKRAKKRGTSKPQCYIVYKDGAGKMNVVPR